MQVIQKFSRARIAEGKSLNTFFFRNVNIKKMKWNFVLMR